MLDGHHAGQFAGQSGGQGADGRLQLLRIHRGDGTNHGGFLLGTVCHHHNFVQGVGLGDQLHQDVRFLAHGDFFVLVAQEADNQEVGGLDGDVEPAAFVGHDAAGFSLDGDKCTRNRGVCLVQDASFHAAVLGLQTKGDKAHDSRKEDSLEYGHIITC